MKFLLEFPVRDHILLISHKLVIVRRLIVLYTQVTVKFNEEVSR